MNTVIFHLLFSGGKCQTTHDTVASVRFHGLINRFSAAAIKSRDFRDPHPDDFRAGAQSDVLLCLYSRLNSGVSLRIVTEGALSPSLPWKKIDGR
jgi:hypothetical protein